MRRIAAVILGTGVLLMLTTTAAAAAPADNPLGGLSKVLGGLTDGLTSGKGSLGPLG
jgi:hypothetical protein